MSKDKNQKKHFIAGAVCPRCKSMDTIRVYQLNGLDIRECVVCDFDDQLKFKPKIDELKTRVNEIKEAEEETVKIIK